MIWHTNLPTTALSVSGYKGSARAVSAPRGTPDMYSVLADAIISRQRRFVNRENQISSMTRSAPSIASINTGEGEKIFDTASGKFG